VSAAHKTTLSAFLLLALPFVAVGLLLWAGEAGLVGSRGSKTPSWPAVVFARLAWLGTLGLAGSLAVQLRHPLEREGLLLLTSIAGFAAFATGFYIVGVAWAGERQNYWDAVHFTSLLWFSVVGAFSSFLAARAASKAGSDWGKMLQGPAVVCIALLAVGWLWTWCRPLQELQAEVARYFFLFLHG